MIIFQYGKQLLAEKMTRTMQNSFLLDWSWHNCLTRMIKHWSLQKPQNFHWSDSGKLCKQLAYISPPQFSIWTMPSTCLLCLGVTIKLFDLLYSALSHASAKFSTFSLRKRICCLYIRKYSSLKGREEMQAKKKLNNVYLNDIYISFYHVLQIQNMSNQQAIRRTK